EFLWTGRTFSGYDFENFFYGYTDYVVSGFRNSEDLVYGSSPSHVPYETDFGPFIMNSLYRNFTFSLTNIDDDRFLTNGVDRFLLQPDGIALNSPSKDLFIAPTNTVPIPAVLSPAASQWTYFAPLEIFCGCELARHD